MLNKTFTSYRRYYSYSINIRAYVNEEETIVFIKTLITVL
jgi:hypothetical protein